MIVLQVLLPSMLTISEKGYLRGFLHLFSVLEMNLCYWNVVEVTSQGCPVLHLVLSVKVC